jgi:hypothetical protein
MFYVTRSLKFAIHTDQSISFQQSTFPFSTKLPVSTNISKPLTCRKPLCHPSQQTEDNDNDHARSIVYNVVFGSPAFYSVPLKIRINYQLNNAHEKENYTLEFRI